MTFTLDSIRGILVAAFAAGLALLFSTVVSVELVTLLVPLLGTVAAASPVAAGQAAPAPAVVVQKIPFVAAAHEHVEQAFTATVTPGGASAELGPFDVPAYGYIRHLVLELEGVGGVLGTGVLHPDYPWNIFERITLMDTGGSPIFELDGYAAFLANLFGGYAFEQDPRNLDFDGTLPTPRFQLRIPVEINHYDALGAVANQNSAASYKVTLRTRQFSALFTSVGTATAPALTIKGFLEAWSLPNEVDLAGRPQEQFPPIHGTSQYWSSNSKGTTLGANTIPVTRVGNMIRAILFVARDAAGLRISTVFPDPITFQWDGNNLQASESQRGHRRRLLEKLVKPVDLPIGVFGYLFNHSELGRAGDGPPNLFLQTLQSARVEVQGATALAGSVQTIVNEVAPVEVDPSERYETPNRTGFAPGGAVVQGRR